MTRPLPVVLAVALGLAGGLALSGPLSALLRAPEPAEGPTQGIGNPFAGWMQGVSQDLLVLGTDEGGGNTDVITLVRVEGGATRITQIPRDAYIESERWGPRKINALYSLGGVEEIKRELSERLNRPIRHHMIINLSSLRRMADLLGGIEVDVPKRMYYVDNSQGLMIDLQPGRQLLKGRQLEGFLRFRHDEAGDLGRLDRQQQVLQALFRRLGKPENLVRLPSLLMATSQEIRTDLGPMELGGLVTAMGATHLETDRLDGRPIDRDGVSYLEIDWPVQPDGLDNNDGTDAAAQVDAAGQPEAPEIDGAADPGGEGERDRRAPQTEGRYLF
jgi:LCP family protein required for cell wall assembly